MGTLHYLEYAFEIKLGGLHILRAAALQKAPKCKGSSFLGGARNGRCAPKCFQHSAHGLDQSTAHPCTLIYNPRCILTTRHFAFPSSNTALFAFMDTIHKTSLPSHQLLESYLAFKERTPDKLMAVLLILPITSHCEN